MSTVSVWPSRAVPVIVGARCVDRRRRVDARPCAADAARRVPAAFVAVTTTRIVVPTSARGRACRSAPSRRDVGAARAARVAAAPLVGVGDRSACRSSVPRSAVSVCAVARRAGDRRRASCSTGGDGGRPPRSARPSRSRCRRVFVAVTTTRMVVPTSAEVSVYVVLVASAMSAQFAPARVAAPPLVGVGDRRRARPRAAVGGERAAVARRARDRRRGGVDGRGGGDAGGRGGGRRSCCRRRWSR